MKKTNLAVIAMFVAALSACSDPVPPQAQYPQPTPQVAAPAQPVIVQQSGGNDGGFDAGSAALGAMAGMMMSGGSRDSGYDRGRSYNTHTRTKTIVIREKPAKTVYAPAKKSSFGSFSSKKVSLSKRRR